MTNQFRVAVAAGALGGILIAGCAQSEPGSPKPSPGGTVTSSPATPPPTSPGEVTVTGTVELVDLEGGCLVLRVDGTTYELQGGDRNVLKHGARVEVRGKVRDDVMTICQMGPVLEVLSSEPA